MKSAVARRNATAWPLPREEAGGSYERARARPPLRPAAVRLRRVELRREPRELRRRDLLPPFVSPLRRRVLFTVAAAIRFAVPALRPRRFALDLIFSY